HFAPDGDALGAGSLQQRRICRHARTRNNQILSEKGIFTVAAKLEAYPSSSERSNRFADFVFAPRVCTSHFRAAQKSAVATPVLASPTTNKRLPRNSNGFGITLANENTLLPQFQGRQREQ